MIRIFIGLIFLAFLPSLVSAEERIIAVKGEASVEVVPDLIRISYSVSQFNRNDVAEAKANVDKISNDSVRSLISLGISEGDITSSGVRVRSERDYDENDNVIEIGYLVGREIDFVVRDIGLYSVVIQSLVDNRVSQIGEVEPDVSNYEELARLAMGKATKNALDYARFLADQFDAEIARVHKIGKQQVSSNFNLLEEIVLTARKMEPANVTNTIYEFKPGKVKVSSEIYVEFQLK